MLWMTRAGVHVDRAACAWLIRRFVDEDADFGLVAGPEEVPEDAIAFDMRGVEHGHHGGDCTFEASMVVDDHQVLELTGPMFDGFSAYYRRSLLLREGMS